MSNPSLQHQDETMDKTDLYQKTSTRHVNANLVRDVMIEHALRDGDFAPGSCKTHLGITRVHKLRVYCSS